MFRFGLRGWLPPNLSRPAESQSLRLSAAVAAALGCVPHGQWALLDADMLVMIDRSACLVELVLVGRALFALSGACGSLRASTSGAASGGCLRISPSGGLVEGLVLLRVAQPELLLSSPFRSGCSSRPGPRSCTPHHFVTVCFQIVLVSRIAAARPCLGCSDLSARCCAAVALPHRVLSSGTGSRRWMLNLRSLFLLGHRLTSS